MFKAIRFPAFCTPAFLMVALLALLVLGQLQRIQLSTHVAFYVHDLLMLVIVGYFGVHKIKPEKLPFPFDFVKKYPVELLFVAWIIGGLGIAAVQRVSLSTPLLYLLRLAIYSLGIFWLVQDQPLTGLSKVLKANDNLRAALIGSGLLVLALGFLQYLFLPDTRFLKILGWDDHYFRLIGTQLDPGFTGMLLVLTFIGVSTFEKISSKMKAIFQFLLVLGIALTFSRATYLSFLVSLLGLLSYQLKQANIKRALGYCVLGVWLGLAILIAPKPSGEGVRLARTSTVTSRTTYTQEWLTTLQPHQWVVGRGMFVALPDGPNQDPTVPDHAQVPDNIFVFLVSSTGVVGTILAIVIGLKYAWKWRSFDGVIVSLLAVLSHSLFNNTLLQPFVWIWLWLGIAAVLL